MTVRDLIDALTKMPPDLDVTYDGYQGLSDVTEVALTTMNAKTSAPFRLDPDETIVFLS